MVSPDIPDIPILRKGVYSLPMKCPLDNHHQYAYRIRNWHLFYAQKAQRIKVWQDSDIAENSCRKQNQKQPLINDRSAKQIHNSSSCNL